MPTATCVANNTVKVENLEKNSVRLIPEVDVTVTVIVPQKPERLYALD